MAIKQGARNALVVWGLCAALPVQAASLTDTVRSVFQSSALKLSHWVDRFPDPQGGQLDRLSGGMKWPERGWAVFSSQSLRAPTICSEFPCTLNGHSATNPWVRDHRGGLVFNQGSHDGLRWSPRVEFVYESWQIPHQMITQEVMGIGVGIDGLMTLSNDVAAYARTGYVQLTTRRDVETTLGVSSGTEVGGRWFLEALWVDSSQSPENLQRQNLDPTDRQEVRVGFRRQFAAF